MDPYSRIYWGVMDDPKFEGIIGNPTLFGTWALMLIVADRAYPDSAFIPTVASRSAVMALADAHLIEVMTGRRYRIHGLEAERDKRSQYARNAAAVRWHSEGNAPPDAQPMLAKDIAKAKGIEETTPPPSKGRRDNGTNPRAAGTNPRAKGTSPRQERDREKRSDMPQTVHDILRRAAAKGGES